MPNWDLLRKRSAQLVQYGIVGVLATASHYALMAILVAAGFTPLGSTTAGATLGAFVAYAANRKWTFEASHTRARMIRFLAVAAFGLVLNGSLLVALLRWLTDSLILAQLTTTAVVFLVTFIINLKWSFR